MKKEKRYYMFIHYCPARGHTRENPPYVCGTGCYTADFPLQNLKKDFLYTSCARAERQAAKNNTLYWRAEVIDVTDIVNREV